MVVYITERISRRSLSCMIVSVFFFVLLSLSFVRKIFFFGAKL